MLAERNDKMYEFKPVDSKVSLMLLELDAHGIRQGLLDQKFTSQDLINFYGNRC
jgi:hypothetical protein